MRKWLNDKNMVPPGGFRYTDPESKMLITAPSWRDLVLRVKSHKEANNFPIQLNIEDDIEAQLTALLPDNFTTDQNPVRSAEVPRTEWPVWAKLLSMVATSEDKGVGSVIERTIGPFGGNAFKVWYAATFGKSCGCSERRESFDAQYPLNQPERAPAS
jgi:hypothetical protein